MIIMKLEYRITYLRKTHNINCKAEFAITKYVDDLIIRDFHFFVATFVQNSCKSEVTGHFKICTQNLPSGSFHSICFGARTLTNNFSRTPYVCHHFRISYLHHNFPLIPINIDVIDRIFTKPLINNLL